MSQMKHSYRFSFGPWNINEGSDPFGPNVRDALDFNTKLSCYKQLGFEGIQFHDDDAIPDIEHLAPCQLEKMALSLQKILTNQGLLTEFVAPRLWESRCTIDGAYTANDPSVRKYAIERTKRAIDLAQILGTNLIVLWLAREGTYIRESKDSVVAVQYIVQAINEMLDYNKHIRIAIEAKPNEPMDHTYIPTTGHAIGIGMLTDDPNRVGTLIESAHAILAGLDPSDEMGYALAHNKLWSVHLNDQNGLKFDQDKSFGSVDLRRAFNQVRLLEKYGYGKNGEFIGLDVKAMRTQPAEIATKHLSNSRHVFLALLEKVHNFNAELEREYIENRDYEGLELSILEHLMSK